MQPLSENELLIYSEAPLEGSFIGPDGGTLGEEPTTVTLSTAPPEQNPSNHNLKFYTETTVTPDGNIHNPRYLSVNMSSAVDTGHEYNELDERFVPPRPSLMEQNLVIGSRLARNPHQMDLLSEVTHIRGMRDL